MPDHPHYYGRGWQPTSAHSAGPTTASPSASADQPCELQAAAIRGKPQRQSIMGDPAPEDGATAREWEQWPQPSEVDAHLAQAANGDKENSR